MDLTDQAQTDAAPAAAEPAYRSGAVARLARMPVATLRIWEQRYRAVRPLTATSGHRLYSPADVQRVLLLRQLTERGHAIGSIAGLDFTQLQEVARTSARAASGTGGRRVSPPAPLRLVVVGPGLAARLLRPAVTERLAHPAQVVAVFASLAEAARAGSIEGADLLVWQSPGLDAAVPSELKATQDAWRARQVAVMYRFSGAVARQTMAATGALLVREPPDDESLGAWLASLEPTWASREVDPVSARVDIDAPLPMVGAVPPRRFDDAALTAMANLPSTLACECPRHVVELLTALASFEAYSADCANRNADDARLHVYLQQVAGASRALFEEALDRVARHEGLTLR